MRVFLTGATGFVGSHILPELLAAGHEVVGLVRSERGVEALATAGAKAHVGSLEDPDSLKAGVARADAVIHTAFDHDFSQMAAACEKERRVLEAMGSALVGSDRPILITSGVALGDAWDGRPADEAVFNAQHPIPRIVSEQVGNDLLDRGVDVRIMRLSQVHDTRMQGLVSPYIDHAREKGAAGYVDDGHNEWSAVHVLDAARLYVLALERGARGSRYHAVAEEGVPMRAIAEVVAAGLGVPTASVPSDDAPSFFGWMATFAGLDMRASSDATRAQLGWDPTGPKLLDDLRAMRMVKTAA